jgi:hypothetical protein
MSLGCVYNACAAAKNGHLNVVKYLHEHGCPWNEFTCSCAVRNGDNLALLKYLHENGCPCDYGTYFEAIDKNFNACATYAKDKMSHDIDMGRMGQCQLKILKYSHSNSCSWDTLACRTGGLEVLKYAHANGCPWCEATRAQSRASFFVEQRVGLDSFHHVY